MAKSYTIKLDKTQADYIKALAAEVGGAEEDALQYIIREGCFRALMRMTDAIDDEALMRGDMSFVRASMDVWRKHLDREINGRRAAS